MKVASFEKREWIDPWRDRRPMTEDAVLVTATNGRDKWVDICNFLPSGGGWFVFDSEEEEILAWMPLPDVWEGETDED